MAAENSAAWLSPPEGRETVDEAGARAWVQPLLDAGVFEWTGVRLSNKSFTPEAAVVVAELLSRCEHITQADLSDIIAGQLEEEALAVMRSVCDALGPRSLTMLNVSDNALGEPGANACAAVLRGQPALEALYICNTGMSAEGAAVVAEMLAGEGVESTQLRTFHYFNNMSGDGGGEALAAVVRKSPLLEDLRFSATRCGRAGSERIAAAVAACPAMTKLDFMDNTLGEEGGQALAAALPAMPALRVLGLCDCALGDEGAVPVAEALAAGGAPLEEWDLSGNDLTTDAMAAVAAAVASKAGSLRRFKVAENEIRARGAATLAPALGACALLEEVSANQNEIKRRGACALVAAVAGHAGLTAVGLEDNELDVEGIAAVTAILEGAGKEGLLDEVEPNDELDSDVEDLEEGEDELAGAMAALSVA